MLFTLFFARFEIFRNKTTARNRVRTAALYQSANGLFCRIGIRLMQPSSLLY